MRDIWVFLFLLGVILFSWPFISMFGHSLALYIFIAWLVFIALIFIGTLQKRNGNSGG